MAELLSSKVVVLEEPPSIRSLPIIPTGLTSFVGIAKRGPIGTPTFVTSFDEYVSIFGSYDVNADMTLAVEQFFRHGGRAAFIVRTVHYTDVTSSATQTALKGDYDIDDRGGAASAAQVDSTAGPWHLTPGDHFDLDFDNGGSQVATIAATSAGEESGSAATYNFGAGGETLTVKIDQGVVQTITFQTGDFAIPAAGTAEEVAAVINAQIVGGLAEVTNPNLVSVYSDTLGTGSYVEITGGTANGILNFPTPEQQGTGNVVDVTQVTPAEIAAMITALPPAGSGTATVITGDKVRLTSGATGAAAEVEVEVATVQRVTVFTVGVYLGSAAGLSPTLKVAGKYYGDYADSISVEIKAPTSEEADEFNLEVSENSILQETWPNLSMTDTADNYVEDVVNDATTGSSLIECTDLDSPASSPNDLPAIGTYTLTGGDDGLTSIADVDFIGSDAGDTGFYALDPIQDLAIGPLVPNRCTAAVQAAQISYAETHRNGSMFVVLGPPASLSASQVVTYIGTTASLEGLSEYGAFYWPRTKVINPSSSVYGANTSELIVDPVGIIAGIYVRTDNSLDGGVYRAPAGLEYGKMDAVIGFETDEVLDEAKRDYIVPHRINPLTSFPGAPRFIDGHDTLKGNSNFPSVPERRGVIYIEQSIKRGLEVYRHSPNDARTRGEVNATIIGFLLAQMNARAFRSTDPSTAFGVDTSDAINPPSDQFAGKMNVQISLATNRPNKWIVLTFSQDVRALEEEVAIAQSGT